MIDNLYLVWAQDGNIVFCTTLSGDEITEFESGYKANANVPVDKREVTTGMLQFKPRPVEATLVMNYIYFVTGDSNSLDQGGEINWSINVSEPGITKVRFSPDFGYYIDGGGIRILSGALNSPVKCRVTSAPDIPEEYGGSVTFVKNKSFEVVGDKFEIAAPSKYVKYYPTMPPASVIELRVDHGPADAIKIEFFVRTYK